MGRPFSLPAAARPSWGPGAAPSLAAWVPRACCLPSWAAAGPAEDPAQLAAARLVSVVALGPRTSSPAPPCLAATLWDREPREAHPPRAGAEEVRGPPRRSSQAPPCRQDRAGASRHQEPQQLLRLVEARAVPHAASRGGAAEVGALLLPRKAAEAVWRRRPAARRVAALAVAVVAGRRRQEGTPLPGLLVVGRQRQQRQQQQQQQRQQRRRRHRRRAAGQAVEAAVVRDLPAAAQGAGQPVAVGAPPCCLASGRPGAGRLGAEGEGQPVGAGAPPCLAAGRPASAAGGRCHREATPMLPGAVTRCAPWLAAGEPRRWAQLLALTRELGRHQAEDAGLLRWQWPLVGAGLLVGGVRRRWRQAVWGRRAVEALRVGAGRVAAADRRRLLAAGRLEAEGPSLPRPAGGVARAVAGCRLRQEAPWAREDAPPRGRRPGARWAGGPVAAGPLARHRRPGRRPAWPSRGALRPVPPRCFPRTPGRRTAPAPWLRVAAARAAALQRRGRVAPEGRHHPHPRRLPAPAALLVGDEEREEAHQARGAGQGAGPWVPHAHSAAGRALGEAREVGSLLAAAAPRVEVLEEGLAAAALPAAAAGALPWPGESSFCCWFGGDELASVGQCLTLNNESDRRVVYIRQSRLPRRPMRAKRSNTGNEGARVRLSTRPPVCETGERTNGEERAAKSRCRPLTSKQNRQRGPTYDNSAVASYHGSPMVRTRVRTRVLEYHGRGRSLSALYLNMSILFSILQYMFPLFRWVSVSSELCEYQWTLAPALWVGNWHGPKATGYGGNCNLHTTRLLW